MKKSNAVDQALRAHANLNAFEAVISILESGCLYGGSPTADRTAEKIITLCKAEQQRQLKLHDAALAKIA